ncbi:DUF1292 domain-containing protein [Eubacterium sp. MSJ-13]|uniref:DUF1292 domain-containing protein n=1 Tax=Eubacterium sp. MSJ-13 TaxID=2841513 RepID=UPI001C0F5CD2|nr:DUF1292 domain-containing protein [Eubacterium sp. MSJ-13]MBU5477681.1 DUF1292 domain-containing protein [Eubacterium sp. MSJ-13]
MKIEELAGNYCTMSTEEEDFEVEICDTVEFDNKSYVFMLPVDEPDSEDIYIAQENINGDVCEYYPVENDTLLNTLFEIFKERNSEQFKFED